MGVCLGMTGDGASKKSRSGSSKTESTARIATAAPPNPPLELFEEDDDDIVLTLADDVAVETEESEPTLDISSACRELRGHCCSTC